jgi:hypothetical protein
MKVEGTSPKSLHLFNLQGEYLETVEFEDAETLRR